MTTWGPGDRREEAQLDADGSDARPPSAFEDRRTDAAGPGSGEPPGAGEPGAGEEVPAEQAATAQPGPLVAPEVPAEQVGGPSPAIESTEVFGSQVPGQPVGESLGESLGESVLTPESAGLPEPTVVSEPLGEGASVPAVSAASTIGPAEASADMGSAVDLVRDRRRTAIGVLGEFARQHPAGFLAGAAVAGAAASRILGGRGGEG
jgi:hypothetical protein